MFLTINDFAPFLVEYTSEGVDHFDIVSRRRDLRVSGTHNCVDVVEPRVDLGAQKFRLDCEHHRWKLVLQQIKLFIELSN